MKNFIWLLLGLLLGISVGVGYAWVVRPGEFAGATPNTLRAEYRGEYLMLIAASYDANGNLARARERLAEFPNLDAPQLAALAQQVTAMQGPEAAARGLARLSMDLLALTPTGLPAAATVSQSASPSAALTATLESTLAVTFPSFPTAAPQTDTPPAATLAPRFALVSKEQVCEGAGIPPSIRVVVRTPAGAGVAGVALVLRWPGGEGRFVTGMAPERGAGFADYRIEKGIMYELLVGDGFLVVRDLSAPNCAGIPAAYPGLWLLTFEAR